MAEQHTNALFRWVVGKCQDSAEAWDFVQGAFERALRARPRVASHKDLRAWLMVVIRNLFLDECRTPEKRCRTIQELDATEAPEVQAMPIWRQIDIETVNELVPRLTAPVREVFRLRASGCSMTWIAAHLQIPVRTVYTRLHRARKQLRGLLLAGVGPPARSHWRTR